MTKMDGMDVRSQLENKISEILPISGNCAQTSFLVLEEVLNIEGGEVFKALTPFPGIALRGETCGAVAGSLMVIGLMLGRGREEMGDWSAYLRSLRPARKFCFKFESKFGSLQCGDIVEKEFGRRFNLANPAESMEWLSCGAVEKCGRVILEASEIVFGIIQPDGVTKEE